ncbi:MAG: flagellar hook-basal body protein [Gemmatimonas sp.]
MPVPIRNNGLTSAASAMQMLERRQQVLANNLANANTRGFKAESVFARLIGDAMAAADTVTDRTQGTLTETHNPLDMSLEGNGFFVVEDATGNLVHSRGGAFTMNEDRVLTDASGNAVLGEEGPIKIPNGSVTVSQSGEIRVDQKFVAQLRIETVDARAQLKHRGATQFERDPSATTMPLGERKVHQGYVEESNVNTMAAMTEMIDVMHRYGQAQKSIATIDSIRGIAVNDLAKAV